MRTIIFIVGILFIQIQRVFSESSFGNVFPIPVTTSNDDPNFQHCPVESGAYAHTTNCSLFHMCTFRVLTTYSCIDGFFFNPSSGKCQYLPIEKAMKCTEIVKEMTETDYFPSAEPVKGYDYYHRRKSATSTCTQTGIYPDVLDCSLFHYCHQNKQHEIFQCPNGLHFDPKLFMCSPIQLVDCQYEPAMEIDSAPTIKSNTICRDYTSGTHLPVANKFDEFIVCENDGTSTLNKCEPGSRYNALTTKCERRPCEINPNLCQNLGHCVDEPTSIKGFRCICSTLYQGEYCDKPVEIVQAVKNKVDTSSIRDLLPFTNRQTNNQKFLTTSQSTLEIDLLQETTPFANVNDEEKMNIIYDLPTINSPLSRLFRRLNTNLDQQNRVTELTQVVFITIFSLIGLILLASMIFGAIVCIRMMFSSPSENVGTWKVLSEESKV